MLNLFSVIIENKRVNAATENVGIIRWPIISVTDVLPNRDSPKSPCKRLPNQIPSWTYIGSLSPKLSLINSYFSAVAWVPTINAAGSPGAM